MEFTGYPSPMAAHSSTTGKRRLTVIGGGKMGAAIVSGLLSAGWPPVEITVVEPSAKRRKELVGDLPGVTTIADAVIGVEHGPGVLEDVLLAVKPHMVASVLPVVAGAGATRVLSIAAGVSLATMASAAGEGVRTLRSMPNTPAMVGAGASALVTDGADEADLAWAEEILGAVGTVVRVPESLIDAVTGLSGSGPAYVFLVAEALTEGGVLLGLPRPTAAALAHQTLMGSGRLLTESNLDPAVLRANVTSPGGTTAAGLAALEERATRAAFIAAVSAAAQRSTELG